MVNRRGFALAEALVGGVVLAIGIAVVVKISMQSMANQRRGEFAVAAAAILDGLLGEVLVTGVEEFQTLRPSAGPCDDPWTDFSYEVTFSTSDPSLPYEVRATVTDPLGHTHICETRIAARKELEEEERNRRPEEPIDRQARHDELEGETGG